MKLVQEKMNFPIWGKATLVLAGIYNLAWGAFVVLFPLFIFEATGLDAPLYPQIWQCVGMIVGVYGIGYLIASTDPARHWPIVLVGLIGKVLGPIGFLGAALSGTLPWDWAAVILTNDLIWWLPFAAILFWAFRAESDVSSTPEGLRQKLSFEEAIHNVRSQRGATLSQLSNQRPTLVVFLRHAGCTFCREAVEDLSRQREQIESLGVQLAIIHMSDPMQATRMTSRADLDDVHRFSDPYCALYEAFGLERGSLKQLLGLRVWLRGFSAGFVGGHGVGTLEGDGFRMPGAFLMSGGKIVAAYKAQTAADRPNYIDLADTGFKDEACDIRLQGVAS
ncbi:MAG: redoxin domain-containing protein [Planctomycetaceae bacterium]|nr:redoxin domain-containing protein [Planctomycetaceae bacterium]